MILRLTIIPCRKDALVAVAALSSSLIFVWCCDGRCKDVIVW